MAKMIDLDSFGKLDYYSDFEIRCLNVLDFLESIFGPVFIDLVNVESSNINEHWPHFNIISDVNFSANSPLVPRISFSVNVKPIGVLKLFCDHSNLIWEHVNNISSRPLTKITKCP